MRKPLVSIIVVNWNGADVLENCFDSLSKINYPNWELIFVDNGSTDNSFEILNKYSPVSKERLQVIKNRINVGFAPANNQGLEVSKGEYVLLLNNDTKVTKDFLSLMIEKMELEKQIGVMQPKIHMMDSPERLDNCGSFLTWTGFLYHWGFGEKDSNKFDSERLIHTAKGACLLVRGEVIQKLKLFDDDFVSYFEESDFCGRVWLAGWQVVYFPKPEIYHKVGFTSKKLIATEVNYHSLKNRILSYLKNFELRGIITVLIPHLLVLKLLAIIYLVKFDFAKFAMVVKAIWWNIINLSKTLAKRSEIQKLRVVSDKEIFDKVMVGWKLTDMIKHFFLVEKNFQK
ncbi:glycosyltransferase family 2 protein [Candidatus Microgenomates bacterium]|nr:glycosyltransferase family 2 protein [Candidatus Microgenomates bacterium]